MESVVDDAVMVGISTVDAGVVSGLVWLVYRCLGAVPSWPVLVVVAGGVAILCVFCLSGAD